MFSKYLSVINSNLIFFKCVLSSGRDYVLLTELDYIMQKYFGPDLPPISQLEKRAKLALINANPIIDNLEPLLPNVIPVGGIHIKKSKPLPKVNSILFEENTKCEWNFNIFLIAGFGNLFEFSGKGNDCIFFWFNYSW